MKRTFVWATGVALTLAALSTSAWQAVAGADLVKFPETYAAGVQYATVKRGNITEELFTSHAAIDAVKAGQPIPSGTVITMEDYRDGSLFRFVVMDKGAGWGTDHPAEKRNGEWEFQAFNADKSVNRSENLDRRFAGHKGPGPAGFRFHPRSHEERPLGARPDQANTKEVQVRQIGITIASLLLVASSVCIGQRLLKALRKKAAEKLVAEATVTAPSPGPVGGSGYMGPDPPTDPLAVLAIDQSDDGRSAPSGNILR